MYIYIYIYDVHIHSLSLLHTHTHTHTHTVSLSLSLSHTHTHTLSLRHQKKRHGVSLHQPTRQTDKTTKLLVAEGRDTTGLAVYLKTSTKKTRKAARHTTDLAVNTQTHQHEEDQEGRETHSQPTWLSIPRHNQHEEDQEDRDTQLTRLSIPRHTRMKIRKTKRHTTDPAEEDQEGREIHN